MLLCVAAMATFSSCTKNEEPEDLIVGKWRCTYSSDDSSNIGMIWEFKSNGKMTTSDRSDVMYGKENDYKVEGSTLSFLGGLITYTIDKLTSSQLELTYVGGYSFKLKFSKSDESGSGSGSGSGTGTSGGGSGSGTSGGGHGGGSGKSASYSGNGNWLSSYEEATKSHGLMFAQGEKAEVR